MTESEFNEQVKDGVVLVDFYTTMCGPCRVLAPILDQLENAKIVKVDANESGELAVAHGVSVVPTLKFFKDGVLQETMVGVQNKDVLQGKIDGLNAS